MELADFESRLAPVVPRGQILHFMVIYS